MPHDQENPGSQVRERINCLQEQDLHAWCSTLHVSPERLKQVVATVGARAERVREYLQAHETDRPSRKSRNRDKPSSR